MNTSMATMEMIADTRHVHCSNMVGNTMSQEARCRAPKETPNRHVIGHSLEWYRSGSQWDMSLPCPNREFCMSMASCRTAFCSKSRGIRRHAPDTES